MEIFQKLDAETRLRLTEFTNAHRHDKQITDLDRLNFVARGMEIVAQTPLTNEEKKELVMYLYNDVAQDDRNDYPNQFDISGAIEFLWNINQKKFKVKFNKKGFMSFLCCKSASIAVDARKKNIDFKTNN